MIHYCDWSCICALEVSIGPLPKNLSIGIENCSKNGVCFMFHFIMKTSLNSDVQQFNINKPINHSNLKSLNSKQITQRNMTLYIQIIIWNRQAIGGSYVRKSTNNDLQNTTQKTKYRAMRTALSHQE